MPMTNKRKVIPEPSAFKKWLAGSSKKPSTLDWESWAHAWSIMNMEEKMKCVTNSLLYNKLHA